MEVHIKQISGWKWDSLDVLSADEALCQTYFNLPKGANDKTTICIGYMTNFGIKDEVLFYYIADTAPSQFTAVLGAPETFDILIIE